MATAYAYIRSTDTCQITVKRSGYADTKASVSASAAYVGGRVTYILSGSSVSVGTDQNYSYVAPSEVMLNVGGVQGYLRFSGWYTMSANSSSPPSASDATKLVSSSTSIDIFTIIRSCSKVGDYFVCYPKYGFNVILRKDENSGSTEQKTLSRSTNNFFRLPSKSSWAKEGFTQTGWKWSNGSSDIEFAFGSVFNTPSLTQAVGSLLTTYVYGLWVENPEVFIVFDPNGGEIDVNSMIVVRRGGVKYNSLPVPTRDGEIFLGWFYGDALVTEDSYVALEDHVLMARWSGSHDAGNVTVYLDPCEGAVSLSSVLASERYPNLPIPSRSGYSFAGWFSTPFGNVQIHAGDAIIVDEDHTIYARWNREKFVITFDPNGGTCSQTTKDVLNGNAIGKLPIATIDDKNFDGWYTDRENGEKVSASTVITSSITVYAHYSTFKTTPWVTITISD